MVIESPYREQILWEDWLLDKSEESESKLIKHYMYLVTFHVDRIAVNLPVNVHKDDLISFAYAGLLDAIHKFEPDRDLKFDTYASFRVRGSIIDGLRKEDWLPRAQREKTKKVEKATKELEQQLQRTPTTSEIAEELMITKEEVETLVKDMMFSNVLSIDQPMKTDDNDIQEGIGYTIPDDVSIQPDEMIVDAEIKNELVETIKQLNENEQLVISLFYDEELTMTEIGDVLQLTTSRISQIHKTAISKLRIHLEKIQSN